MTQAVHGTPVPRRHATSPNRALSWATGGIAALALLAAVNGGLFLAAPDLFRVDLAKGPYTEANNLELTRVYGRAITLYKEIAERYPESEYAILSRIGIANSSIGLGRPQDAIGQYEALLASFGDDPSLEKYRYKILERMAVLYRDAAENEKFADIFAQLEKNYPDSSAVREGRVYLAQVQASAKSAAAGLPADFPFRLDAASISVPATAKVGEEITITLVVTPAAGKTPDFSLMTALGIYKGFTVRQITPNPRSIADFWGKRAWQYPGIDKPFEVKAILKAKAPGDYTFDLDIETNFNVTELGIAHSIKVE